MRRKGIRSLHRVLRRGVRSKVIRRRFRRKANYRRRWYR